ncbi:MAG: hypothetical protein LBQ39_01940 [Tannerellaceae bacterium]|jgi:hypothetical protein|nr:hypothetical protein [Tannerellaceae bacterium]
MKILTIVAFVLFLLAVAPEMWSFFFEPEMAIRVANGVLLLFVIVIAIIVVALLIEKL